MMQLVVAVQPLLVGVVLLWAAGFKLASRHAPQAARRSALVKPLGGQRALLAFRLLGAVELAVAAVLLLPAAWSIEAFAAAALSAGFLAYLGYARVRAPGSSCGCMGAAPAPVRGRSFGRAGLLLVASVVAMFATTPWFAALAADPVLGPAVVLIEAAAFVALSPELDAYWLLPLRRLRATIMRPLTQGSGTPLLSSVQQLQQSAAYRRVGQLLRSDVLEHWEQDEFRIVCYAARYQGRPATAAFAVPRLRHDPPSVRVAIVDDATGLTLAAYDSTVDHVPEFTPDEVAATP